MYNIVNRKYIVDEITHEELGSVCEIQCDSFGDIPTSDDIKRENMLPMSWLWISNERTFLTLNAQGGYIITYIKPSDWETVYTDYFVKTESGTLKPITDPTAPEWVENTYYYYTDKPSFV